MKRRVEQGRIDEKMNLEIFKLPAHRELGKLFLHARFEGRPGSNGALVECSSRHWSEVNIAQVWLERSDLPLLVHLDENHQDLLLSFDREFLADVSERVLLRRRIV